MSAPNNVIGKKRCRARLGGGGGGGGGLYVSLLVNSQLALNIFFFIFFWWDVCVSLNKGWGWWGHVFPLLYTHIMCIINLLCDVDTPFLVHVFLGVCACVNWRQQAAMPGVGSGFTSTRHSTTAAVFYSYRTSSVCVCVCARCRNGRRYNHGSHTGHGIPRGKSGRNWSRAPADDDTGGGKGLNAVWICRLLLASYCCYCDMPVGRSTNNHSNSGHK